ncbi:conserved hypothetical protein [Ricinus communis]|uniref:Uncharacterized protein n=1 Tax=Ricinus communis TaxID=3988 RepID=B9S4X6_RICCO|nr:conserved hypothetical protein [Ricinus communis]
MRKVHWYCNQLLQVEEEKGGEMEEEVMLKLLQRLDQHQRDRKFQAMECTSMKEQVLQ